MGYIEETGAAQILRDARIAAIYEGTNGIQAIDLVTRKLALDEVRRSRAKSPRCTRFSIVCGPPIPRIRGCGAEARRGARRARTRDRRFAGRAIVRTRQSARRRDTLSATVRLDPGRRCPRPRAPSARAPNATSAYCASTPNTSCPRLLPWPWPSSRAPAMRRAGGGCSPMPDRDAGQRLRGCHSKLRTTAVVSFFSLLAAGTRPRARRGPNSGTGRPA